MERDPDLDDSQADTRPNRPSLRRRRFAALAASLSLPLAGCRTGDSDDDSPGTATSRAGSGGTEPRGGAVPTDTEGSTGTAASTPVEAGRYGGSDDPVADPVGLETVAAELNYPIDVAFPPGTDLIYLVTLPGKILVYEGGEILDEPLLDIGDQVVLGGERGLLGIEPHPEFADNGRLFVRYSAPSRLGTPADYSHTFVVAEFEVGADRRRADPVSERTILEIPEPQDNHNAGDLAFGPDGYLYVPTGDGGNEFDIGPHHPEDWYDFNAGGNGQNTSDSLLGGILRIDVDDTGEDPYAIPSDNPLVDVEGHRDEYYAWGLRNPFRMSFDGEDLFVGNVGEHQWESVTLVEKGGNYGWNVREGSHCFDASDDYNTPDSCPTRTPSDVRGGEPILDPILEYVNERNEQLDPNDHLSGVAVTGGYVYRGSALPELEGRYLFSDLEHQGRLFVGTPPSETGDGWSLGHVNLTGEAADDLGAIYAFGRDGEGEMYVVAGNALYRIVPG
jgi:glucose/arabinose dehydrogenase